MNNTKSATTAGLLGIFLGGVGAHDWYLGNRNKALLHIALVGGALGVMFVTSIFLPAVLSRSTYLDIEGVLSGINILAWGAVVTSIVWGAIEGLLLLEQGDDGLIKQNFVVVNPDQMIKSEDTSGSQVKLDLNDGLQSSNTEVVFYPQDDQGTKI